MDGATRMASRLARSPFPPIGDYGFLSDCESVALVAPSGNVEWLCLPRVDSPSVFGAILARVVSEPDRPEGLFATLVDRFAAVGGIELEAPRRSTPARVADLSG